MPDRGYRVLSAIGPDQPGLVARLSAFLADRGANVEDSRMATLGGSFGVMMLISANPQTIERIERESLDVEEETGLRIHLIGTDAPQVIGGMRRYQVTAEAADREGIVHAIADTLFRLGGNIVSLESGLYPAPVSGAPLFRLDVIVDVPDTVSEQDVLDQLGALGQSEDLDIDVSPVARGEW